MWTCPKRRAPAISRVGIHDNAGEFRLKVEGPLGASESRELQACWKTAESTIGSRRFVVDLTKAASVDGAARELLGRMRASGAIIENREASILQFRLTDLLACLVLRLKVRAHLEA
jgi:hypothetical protein